MSDYFEPNNGATYYSTPTSVPSYYPPEVVEEASYFTENYLSREALYSTPAEFVASTGPTYLDVEAFNNGFEDLDDDDDDDDVLAAAVQELSLSSGYEREAADPKHRMGDLLQTAFDIYSQLRDTDSATGNQVVDSMIGLLRSNARSMTLYNWLDSIPEYQRVVMISSNIMMRMKHKSEANLSPSMVVAFVRGVKYLDAVARQTYKLEIQGSVKQQDKPFDTTEMKTVHSGPGYAIWVAGGGPANFYAGNHVKGQFHHSSFLAGGNVVCGGELVVRNGKLRLLTGKTGHYRAGTKNFVEAIRLLQGMGISPNSYRVLVWNKFGDAPIQPCPFASDVLADPDYFLTWNMAYRRRLPKSAWDI